MLQNLCILYLRILPNSLSIMAAVTDEESTHLHLETGCHCQPRSSYLGYQMPGLPKPHTVVANRAIIDIVMWLNWHAFFLHNSMHGTTSGHQPDTEIEAMAEQQGVL